MIDLELAILVLLLASSSSRVRIGRFAALPLGLVAHQAAGDTALLAAAAAAAVAAMLAVPDRLPPSTRRYWSLYPAPGSNHEDRRARWLDLIQEHWRQHEHAPGELDDVVDRAYIETFSWPLPGCQGGPRHLLLLVGTVWAPVDEEDDDHAPPHRGHASTCCVFGLHGHRRHYTQAWR